MARRQTAAWVDELEAVYRARIGSLRRVAHAITGDAEAARDVVQEAFVSAIRTSRHPRERSAVEAWMWRIVVNRAISERRRRTRWAALPRPALEHDPGVNNGASRGIADAVASLPQRQRLVVFLHYYADLDYAATADALGISPGTVSASLHAARKSLHAALAPEEVLT
jgi:RNA polymerase sigma factor (sigma-70 family)